MFIFPPEILPTRYVEASLEDLIHGPGVIMVMSQQLGAVAHHGPATSIFMLTQSKRETNNNFYNLLLNSWGVEQTPKPERVSVRRKFFPCSVNDN